MPIPRRYVDLPKWVWRAAELVNRLEEYCFRGGRRDIATLANSATPSIGGGRVFLTGGTTTITDFTDGELGQVLQILSEHAITITDGTNIFLSGGANFTMADGDTLTLIQKADGNWYELSRSLVGGRGLAWQYHDALDVGSGTASVECATDFPSGTRAIRFFGTNFNLASSATDILIQVESSTSGYLTTGYNQQASRNLDNSNADVGFRVRRTNTADKAMGHGELVLLNDDDIWSFQFNGQENPIDSQGINYLTQGYIDIAGESLINLRVNPNGQTFTGTGVVYVQVYAPLP